MINNIHGFKADITLQVKCGRMEANNGHMGIENLVNIVEARPQL